MRWPWGGRRLTKSEESALHGGVLPQHEPIVDVAAEDRVVGASVMERDGTGQQRRTVDGTGHYATDAVAVRDPRRLFEQIHEGLIVGVFVRRTREDDVLRTLGVEAAIATAADDQVLAQAAGDRVAAAAADEDVVAAAAGDRVVAGARANHRRRRRVTG